MAPHRNERAGARKCSVTLCTVTGCNTRRLDWQRQFHSLFDPFANVVAAAVAGQIADESRFRAWRFIANHRGEIVAKLQAIGNALKNREGILIAKILMVLSASIIFMLGAVHFSYTFWGTNLTPRDPGLQISMSQIAPVITPETTMWRCWVGFNASHSMGLILFGLVFGFLAVAHEQILFHSPFLLIVGLAMLGGIAVVSKVYFFRAPFMSVSVALGCYVASIALSRAAVLHS